MEEIQEKESTRFIYDVFLSFRGEDTRHTFVGHLRKELSRRGIHTFFDDRDLKIGKVISPALSNAIDESKILMVVFSENYASSTWCLDELVKILECSRDNKQLVFPIFYHVDPSDIRHQRNSYGDAMIAHENRFGKSSKKVQAWRLALSEASNLPGHHINIGYETIFIEEIVEKVYRNIAPKPLHSGQNPVGLGPPIEKVKSKLEMKHGDKAVHMLGIYGLGGIGKTELAKALYDNIVQDFDAASFLADVREKSNKINGLEDLQKTLLSEMLEELQTDLGSTSKGMYEIKRRLRQKKVLLVLDDVDDKDQLEKLAGGCDWFGSGSRIIITTRDKDVLFAHKVEKTYEMKELNEQHSLELFCWNAFKQYHPKIGFENVCLRAIDFAKRLPLALKVIGSDLAVIHEESLEAWECALEEYQRTPPNEKILNVLKISYDRLGDNAKQVFLDIACFFKGEKIEHAKKIFEEFGSSNINVLVNKSLLSIEYGCLKMHDLIQDMGREIVRQETPNPGERSRLWYYEDVIEILTEDSGSNKIQGIMLDPPQREEVCWSGTEFEKMKGLRILIIRNTSFSSEPEHLPNHLRVLDWEEYPSKSLPTKFHPKKIFVLNLRKSHLTLEEPFKKFLCLTDMNFSHNQSITEIPDVSEVQNLRELKLDSCRNLTVVHESVGFLKRLAHLSASECSKLKYFLRKMFLPSLAVLDLNLCVRLEHFPEIMKQMNKPLKIYMIKTAIKELPESVGNLTGLVCIEMPSSRKLKYLPSSLFTLPNVDVFKIGGCTQLRESFRSFLQSPSAPNVSPTLRTLYFGNGGLSDEDLLTILHCFPKLEELIASDNNFVSLPACIKECVHLTSLDASLCRELQKIPECINLRILNVYLCGKLEDISELPSTTQKVDARYCFSLTSETSNMLWFQAAKGIHGLEVVMPETEIPEWFDFIGNGDNPHFWARGKFPLFSLALVFQDVNGRVTQYTRRQLVELHLVINGKCVPRQGYYNFRIAADHVLICDLRVLFSDKEWLGLDALLDHDWNVVQILYEAASTLRLTCWGVYVHEEGITSMEDVQFTCPDPKYSDMLPAIVPKKDPMQKRRKMIEESCLDEKFDGMLMETMDLEERDDIVYADKDFAIEQLHILMGRLKELQKEAKDGLQSNGSALEDKDSILTFLLDTLSKKETESSSETLFHKDLALIPVKDKGKGRMEIGEASSSGHLQGREDEQHNDPQQQEILREIFYDGITDALLEAQNKFPSLDIIKTRSAALNKGNRVAWSPEGNVVLPTVEKRTYTSGILSGLDEAKLSFPDLDIWPTLNTVASRRGIKASFTAPPTAPQLDWTTVIPPPHSDNNSLSQPFMNMKQQSLESEGKNKLFWQLKEEHQSLRDKFAQLENENDAPEKNVETARSWKNEYDELIEKFNSVSDEFVAKKLDCTDDLKYSASSSAGMLADVGCKCETKYEKVDAVLKGRSEELQRLHNAEIKGFQNLEKIQDLMSAIYLNGLRDGLLEARAILLALDMDRKSLVVKENNEECVIGEVANNENPSVVNVTSSKGPDVDNYNPSGSKDFFNWQEFV